MRYLKITEETQTQIFDNEFEVNDGTKEETYNEVSKKVYSKLDKGYIVVNRCVKIDIPEHKEYRTLNDFDKTIHNGVCSLYANGTDTFTTEELYRLVTGDSTKQFSSGNCSIKKSIENSLANLSFRKVTITFEDEAEKFKLLDQNGNKIVYVKNYMLPLAEVMVRMPNGKEVKSWKLLSKPPLYTYAVLKHQIDSISVRHLNIPLNFNETNTKLREYLLGRILMIKGNMVKSGMKKKYKNCATVNLSTLYKKMDIDVGNGTKSIMQRERFIDKVVKCLNYWKDETGLLENWKYVLKDGEIDGFEFYVNVENFKEVRTTIDPKDFIR